MIVYVHRPLGPGTAISYVGMQQPGYADEALDDQAPEIQVFLQAVNPVALVDKLVIVDRLITAGLINAAIAAMAANPVTKIRFDAAVQIDPTDPDVLAFLAAIGADPKIILAPTP